jgi:predicted phosphoribosyltransferase/dienelactone hydrolase
MNTESTSSPYDRPVEIPVDGLLLRGILNVPPGAGAAVIFAHGSGSSRHSPRNQAVARALQARGLATLLLDLLDEREGDDRVKVFDISLLAERLHAVACWLRRDVEFGPGSLGYFGASTGAAAALLAAARHPGTVVTIVSRGGRPDLAGAYLSVVDAPTLLIVGGDDDIVVDLNRRAAVQLTVPSRIAIIPGATHLFTEPGALEEVARLAGDWFVEHLHPDENSAEEEYVRQRFHNRADAARRLAKVMQERDFHEPLVVGIPRGGVVTASVLARELGAELDIILSRKLRAPEQPELAVGAIAEDGQVFLNDYADRLPGMDAAYLSAESRRQYREILRRKEMFRAVRERAPVVGRTVIVSDDGIATGATMIAALQSLRAEGPRELIVAVPVASPARLAEVRQWCDEVICLNPTEDFHAVGEFYDDFTQVEDEEVVALLQAANSRHAPVR